MNTPTVNKSSKNWRSLASDLKARRKPRLTSEQIEKANKIFEEIEKEQDADKTNRKIVFSN